MYFTREIEQFPERLGVWRERLAKQSLPLAPSRGDPLRDLGGMGAHLERRYREGPDAPLRVALFGPTGAGKSKLFSSLVGRAISPSGFRRPYTRRTFSYLHRSRQALAPGLTGEVALHDDESWRDVLLIDTPDFDSVESSNRAEAERVLVDADAFIFVTDVQKYADAATWEYLDRIFAERKPCRIVLNKVRSDAPVHDLTRRLEERWGERGHEAFAICVPELAVDDDTVIPDDTPALEQLRAAIAAFARSRDAARQIVREAFAIELSRFVSAAADLREATAACRAARDAARASISRRHDESCDKIERLLDLELSGTARDRVARASLAGFERLDVLRGLRRLFELPLDGVRHWLRRGRCGERSSDLGALVADDVVVESAGGFPLVEGAVLAAFDGARRDVAALAPLAPLLDSPRFRSARLRHADLRALYDEELADLKARIAEAIAARERPPGARGRAKFWLAQLVFAMVLVALLLVTDAAVLTWIVSLLVLCPIAAKAIASALSGEAARAVGAGAREEHVRLACGIVARSRARVDGFLEASTTGIDELVAVLEEISSFARHEQDIVEGFSRKRYSLGAAPAVEVQSAGKRG